MPGVGSDTPAARISAEPNSGPIMVPNELKACASVSRLCARAGSPRPATSGLAATWTRVMPPASTNSAARNAGYQPDEAAGENIRQPPAITSRPSTMPRR